MNLSQLESARALALGEGKYYNTILPGVLPIITSAVTNSDLEIQRWGADFLAEAFAAPTWSSHDKESVSLSVLPILKDLLEVKDTGVIKSSIQASASIYPLVYRHIIFHPNDTQHWQIMLAVKSNILRRMDSAPPGVRICCVKFVQQIILAQTPGMVADPRRPEQNDISLALVPRDHALIPYANLEAEASGLLDRLLDIIHGDHSDALLVTATLNSLGMLIQRRPVVANKVLASVLNFNPLKLANSPMTPRNKVVMRSMERTTRALLINVIKRNPEGAFNGRIQQYLERMHRMRLDVFDEANRKRPAPAEPTDGLDPAKRQRVGANASITPASIPRLPPGPVSYRQLYTIDADSNTANFDVQAFKDPEQLLKIVLLVLRSIDETKLGNAINIVRSRYLDLSKDSIRTALPVQPTYPVSVDDEEEYEPDFEPDFEPEDAEQLTNRLDGAPPENIVRDRVPEASLAPYRLPEAPPLTREEAYNYGDMTVRRLLGLISATEEVASKAKGTKNGFNRLAANTYDRDAWVTILSRLATRARGGLLDANQLIKSEYHDAKKGRQSLSDTIREAIYTYIMYDWRKRIDVAVNWLTEEWYNDRIQADATRLDARESVNGTTVDELNPNSHYKRCVLRVLDGIVPFVEGSDKGLLRLMSEIPELDKEILQRMKKMAEDPERIDLSIMVLQYIYMFKPPARKICIQVLEEMWYTNDRAKPKAKKLLVKWKPEVLETRDDVKMEHTSSNGNMEAQSV
ncbi:hypothetical protein BU24DRAFT_424082 [Aaosphaeria arxii CBS 175.79]|uniref:Symplekin/Pta1 N-terminal domain-containing protein n=1 Tax=Aaosphaeria arxii CBS 175.79 TaxID=1450172 RepID=A0A6A5XJW6_9PLEO|nr:uncharacterized protein BU24DRAFT_424082 [Aaosphaeria arxii CBS 175.79]KAF2013097.1 hypothetical protein BU24DRAFT_424082 [Aaosphaeria arxii CBS 175.79]